MECCILIETEGAPQLLELHAEVVNALQPSQS